ncbi:hypothetical protein QUB70_28830 [Microcoleus sp. A003_D6]|uniref:hypothetical protein n=1 Tax=Microcoleus sp. A003_D6 TaxID=3055266 RepID=UPI002FD110FC
MHHSTYRPVMSMFSTAAARQSQWMRLLADRCGLGAGQTAKDAKLGLCTINRCG